MYENRFVNAMLIASIFCWTQRNYVELGILPRVSLIVSMLLLLLFLSQISV